MFHPHLCVEDMIESFLLESRSVGGLNGFVSGGPRSSCIMEKLAEFTTTSKEFAESDLERRVRARAAVRLYSAIAAQGRDDVPNGSSSKSSCTALASSSSPPDAASPPAAPSEELLAEDALTAGPLAVGVATVESLMGLPQYDMVVRQVLVSYLKVFRRSMKNLRYDYLSNLSLHNLTNRLTTVRWIGGARRKTLTQHQRQRRGDRGSCRLWRSSLPIAKPWRRWTGLWRWPVAASRQPPPAIAD